MDWASEFFGGNRVISLTTDGYKLSPARRYHGACQYYKIASSTGNYYVYLPSAKLSRIGESVVVYNASGSTISLRKRDGTHVAGLSPGVVAETYVLDASTEAGEWHVVTQSNIAESGNLLLNRVPIELPLSSDLTDFNLRNWRDAVGGYDGVTPVSIRVIVGSTTNRYTLGTTLLVPGTDCGFDSGLWPSGSNLWIINFGTITGQGGHGGYGANKGAGTPQAGGSGSPGMRLRLNTAIINYGRIQGGGGGGGGGISDASSAGCGGGGGAGNIDSPGGLAGIGGGATDGVGGQTGIAGGGGSGAHPGGNGGAPGAAGQTGPGGGGAGGAAGSAILRLASVTVTKIVSGTISGAEGTF